MTKKFLKRYLKKHNESSLGLTINEISKILKVHIFEEEYTL
tara:strand:- start:158 stop:280 length:123 start_codon:yes stop_codon:yes gene_type:complete